MFHTFYHHHIMTTSTTRRIYVACLASYNSGVLHGAWIETEGMDEDDLCKEIREKVLLTSRFPNVQVEHPEGSGTMVPSAEEYAIHDHEGFPSGLISEYTAMSEIADLEGKLSELRDDDTIEAFMIYANEVRVSEKMKDIEIDQFRDAYRGKWDSVKDFAEEWAVDTGLIAEDHPMFGYVDWEHYWNADLRHSFTESNGHFFLDE